MCTSWPDWAPPRHCLDSGAESIKGCERCTHSGQIVRTPRTRVYCWAGSIKRREERARSGQIVHAPPPTPHPPPVYTYGQDVETGARGVYILFRLRTHPAHFLYFWAASIQGREECAHSVQIVHTPPPHPFILLGSKYKLV